MSFSWWRKSCLSVCGCFFCAGVGVACHFLVDHGLRLFTSIGLSPAVAGVTVLAASLFSLLSCSISSLSEINACRKSSSWFCSICLNFLARLFEIYHECPVAAHCFRLFIDFPNILRAEFMKNCCYKGPIPA